MGGDKLEIKDYSSLKDFKVEIEAKKGSFCVCFWLYLLDSTAFPTILIKQVRSDTTESAPFLVLNEKKEMVMLPFTIFGKEDSKPAYSDRRKDVPQLSSKTEFPLAKWVHIGCEVSIGSLRLHIDGEFAGEQNLSAFLDKDTESNALRKITLLSFTDDNHRVQGYVHNVKGLPSTFSVNHHYAKDQPFQLSIDNSSASEIEEDSDGVWSIVGGKASCRRFFSLDVVLLDASGHLVEKDAEVVASLLYAEDRSLVENTNNEEAPLLSCYDGIEFSSYDRPSRLVQGRASFKLKISQLSSKCENRLFCVKFEITRPEGYHFLQAISRPIRCISRNRSTKPSTVIWKKTSSVHPLDGSQSNGIDRVSLELQRTTFHEAKLSPSSKRVRLGEAKMPTNYRPDEECNSRAWNPKQVEDGGRSSLEDRLENIEEANNSLSDSESTEGRQPALKGVSGSGLTVSDVTIFRYCLGGLTERSLLLREIATTASDGEIVGFSDKISLYSGCSHHRHQIRISKRLIEEGTKAWNSMSQNNHEVRWENAVFEIGEQFMRIACSSTRSLTQQDFNVLRKVAGCRDYMAQENFEKLWCWFYPVALTLSKDWINRTWKSTSPKWIEGFITKEEAELSLQDPRGRVEPGTFVLRFPTSRSWPHPDAGSLVVTYVGRDYAIHHRLLSLDNVYSFDKRPMKGISLHDMLLSEAELSRLGRVMRCY